MRGLHHGQHTQAMEPGNVNGSKNLCMFYSKSDVISVDIVGLKDFLISRKYDIVGSVPDGMDAELEVFVEAELGELTQRVGGEDGEAAVARVIVIRLEQGRTP